eukprot:7339947-Lingulodinium_polyedra.AAC.1
MESTPVVFSLGQRCRHGGWSCISFAGKLPFMFLPNREAIVLKVKRRALVFDQTCRRHVVDDPEFEGLIGWIHG